MANEDKWVFEMAGFLSGFLSAVSLIPQLLKVVQEGDDVLKGLSFFFLVLEFVSSLMTLIYAIGIYMDEPDYAVPILVTTPVGVICSGALMIMKKRSDFKQPLTILPTKPTSG